MTLTCLACGHQAPDVQMTIVEVPPEEQRIVSQGYPVSWDVRGRVIGIEYRDVVERFVREPRCRDYNPEPRDRARSACLARQGALQPVAPPPPVADEEGPSWLRSS